MSQFVSGLVVMILGGLLIVIGLEVKIVVILILLIIGILIVYNKSNVCFYKNINFNKIAKWNLNVVEKAIGSNLYLSNNAIMFQIRSYISETMLGVLVDYKLAEGLDINKT